MTSTSHFLVVEIDPTAEYDWNRLSVRDPLTSSQPELSQLVAAALGHERGSHLVRVSLSVEVLACAEPEPEVSNLERLGDRPDAIAA